MTLKTATACILLAIVSIYSTAQNFDAGFTLGLTATQVDGDGYGGFDKAGPIAGIWVSRNFKGSWMGRMELRYAQKGTLRKHRTKHPVFTGYGYTILKFPFYLDTVWLWVSTAGRSQHGLPEQSRGDWPGCVPNRRHRSLQKYELAAIERRWIQLQREMGHRCLLYLLLTTHSSAPRNITYRLDRGQYNQALELIIRYKL